MTFGLGIVSPACLSAYGKTCAFPLTKLKRTTPVRSLTIMSLPFPHVPTVWFHRQQLRDGIFLLASRFTQLDRLTVDSSVQACAWNLTAISQVGAGLGLLRSL